MLLPVCAFRRLIRRTSRNTVFQKIIIITIIRKYCFNVSKITIT